MELFRKLGSWLFLIGVLVALIAGIIVGVKWYTDSEAYIAMILGVLGFIVGILSFFALGQITKEKVPTFLIGALILVMIGATSQTWNTWAFGTNTDLVFFFQSLTGYLAFFVAPAAGLLAIRAIWDAGKTEDIEKVIPKIEDIEKVIPKIPK
jgi:hypothetical protein